MAITSNNFDTAELESKDPSSQGEYSQLWSVISRDLVFATDLSFNTRREQSNLLNGFDTRQKKFEIQFAQLDGGQQESVGGEKYIDESLNEDQQNRMRSFDLTEEQNLSILKEINSHGRDPRPALIEIMKNHRVLGIGEMHETPNSQRNLGSEIMEDLRRAGATHLAIEAPAFIQPYLDRFIETGDLNIAALPPLLRNDDFIKILKAARSAGLKISAVDANYKYDETNTIQPPGNITNRNEPLNRDKEMADNISNILKTPENNVIFWVGNAHLLTKNDYTKRITTADYLRENFSVATVRPIIASEREGINYYPLAELTAPIKRSVLVPSNETKVLRDMLWTRSSHPVYAKSWDYILIHP